MTINNQKYVEVKEELKEVTTKKDLEAILEVIKDKELDLKDLELDIQEAKRKVDVNILSKLIIDQDIKMVGPKTANDMSEYFLNARTLLDVIEKGDLSDTLEFIKGVGAKTKELILEKFQDMMFLVLLSEKVEESYSKEIYDIKRKELSADDILSLISEKPEVEKGIKNLNITIIENSFSEEELEEIKKYIQSQGANINKTVYMATNYLLIGEKDYETSFDYAKAQAFSIPIITYQELKDIAESDLIF